MCVRKFKCYKNLCKMLLFYFLVNTIGQKSYNLTRIFFLDNVVSQGQMANNFEVVEDV